MAQPAFRSAMRIRSRPPHVTCPLTVDEPTSSRHADRASRSPVRMPGRIRRQPNAWGAGSAAMGRPARRPAEHDGTSDLDRDPASVRRTSGTGRLRRRQARIGEACISDSRSAPVPKVLDLGAEMSAPDAVTVKMLPTREMLQTIALPATVLAGMAVTSQNAAILGTATFDTCLLY